jgi:hypothetical protein
MVATSLKLKPHGMVFLTAAISSFEPNNSLKTVEVQNAAIVRNASASGIG